jgi:hypothetical protein
MKRLLIAISLCVNLSLLSVEAHTKKRISCKPTAPCAFTLDDFPKEGCNANDTHDPELNELKNIKCCKTPSRSANFYRDRKARSKIFNPELRS